MKKLVVLFALVGLMVFTLSFSALGASQVYFDYIANGEYASGDLSGFNLGLDYKADSFKFGIDYLTGEVEDLLDYTQMNLKGGYGVTENIFITLSMLDITAGLYGIEDSINGFVFGADLAYDFSDQITFEGSFGISFNGEYEFTNPFDPEENFNTEVDLTVLKLKLIYNVADNIGATFGYNNISVEGEGGGSFDISNITLGAAYKF